MIVKLETKEEMETNNQIIIIKTRKEDFMLRHRNPDGSWNDENWPRFKTLEEAQAAANKFIKESADKYQLQILI